MKLKVRYKIKGRYNNNYRNIIDRDNVHDVYLRTSLLIKLTSFPLGYLGQVNKNNDVIELFLSFEIKQHDIS